MPDLGKYAGTVLSAYGVTLALLTLLIAVTVWRSRQVKARLRALEDQRADRHG
jgi:heme exporter protein D